MLHHWIVETLNQLGPVQTQAGFRYQSIARAWVTGDSRSWSRVSHKAKLNQGARTRHEGRLKPFSELDMSWHEICHCNLISYHTANLVQYWHFPTCSSSLSGETCRGNTILFLLTLASEPIILWSHTERQWQHNSTHSYIQLSFRHFHNSQVPPSIHYEYFIKYSLLYRQFIAMKNCYNYEYGYNLLVFFNKALL